MERVQSLINRLYQQSSARASVADLLATTELLYKELAKHGTAQIAANVGSVAVWLPKGFGRAEPNNLSWPATQSNGFSKPAIDNNIHVSPVLAQPIPEVPKEEVSEEEPVAKAIAQKIVDEQPAVLPERVIPVPTVDETPTVSTPIEPEEKLPPIAIVKEEYPLVFQLEVNPSDEEIEAEISAERKKQEQAEARQRQEEEAKLEEAEKQANAENLAPPPIVEKPKVTKPFPGYPDVADVMKKIFPVAPPPVIAKREVNELVADPAAGGLNEKMPARAKELGDVLATAGGKISDIRKAISINEKYQMISSLFRGDEDMFERSVRTLNNFGSLPEARFWMQRELVVKMGWNDEDELVQTFYRLVSRRFS